jgi:hypothetical protein
METAARGNAAEAAVLSALAARGFTVLLPFGDGHPYDLVIHLPAAGFLRVQCKAARERNGCIMFNCCTTDHGRGRLPYIGLAEVFGVYHRRTDSVYLVPVRDAGAYVVTLRTTPTANNQRRKIRFAADYAIDRWTPEQLGSLVEVPDSNSETWTPTLPLRTYA